jgi:hypothetical protein
MLCFKIRFLLSGPVSQGPGYNLQFRLETGFKIELKSKHFVP